ncbi:hypothetical protein ACHAXS_004855 [Conticribra weissflogii]
MTTSFSPAPVSESQRDVDVERPSAPPPAVTGHHEDDDDLPGQPPTIMPPSPRDDEVLPPLAEISFRRHGHGHGHDNRHLTSLSFRDDDHVVDDDDDGDHRSQHLSETSTLLAPSTLTPNYNYNHDCDHAPNALRNRVSDCGDNPTRSSSSSAADHDDIPSKKAFRMAFVLGILCVSLVFYADWIAGDGGAHSSLLPSSSSSNANAKSDAKARSANVAANARGDRIERSAVGGAARGADDDDDDDDEGGETAAVNDGGGATKAAKKQAKAAKLKKERAQEAEYELRGGAVGEQPLEVAAEQWNDGEEELVFDGYADSDADDGGNGDLDEDDDDDDDDFHVPHQSPRDSTNTIINAHADAHHTHSLDPPALPTPRTRCPYVVETFQQQNEGVTNLEFLREKYTAQSVDSNVFYRATALMFWKDFGAGYWGVDADEDGNRKTKGIDLEELVALKEAKYEDGTPMSPMSTWTWITGDQHLSNFGAWRNRGGKVVFSVNDFDEAAIYDFHIDVLRIAVSICSHGFTNGLPVERIKEALEAFTYTYVKTAIDYVGGDTALLFEMTPLTSTGVLRDFLWDTEENNSHLKQIEKFTEVGEDGARRFTRSDKTRLVDVPPEIEEKVRAEITSKKYGASMMKMGWKVRGWDDDFFTVLDVARRVGSGIGSYGVDRFYVLLKGEDTSLKAVDGGGDHASVILDIKFEPKSAVSRVLEEVDQDTKAWYEVMFNNEADRSAQAQRHLTSFTDPFVGYIEIDGNPYNVRQRSPWKTSFDYGKLTDPRAFIEVIEQIAIITATSHVRGSVSKSPAQFKHVIKLLLAGDHNRRRWNDLITNIALRYHEQVLLDFECFQAYVKELFPSN